MRVMWTSARVFNPSVQFGDNPARLDRTARAEGVAYTRAMMCGEPATSVGYRDAGVQYAAVLEGLAPAARVFYRVGSEGGGWSDVASFNAPPPTMAGVGVRIVAFGDMGKGHK
jgi:acid phosphatase type 7